MAFKITLRPEENEKLSSVLADIITSASYFGERDVDIWQEVQNGDALGFIFQKYCPNEYLKYLSWKYDLSLEYINQTQPSR